MLCYLAVIAPLFLPKPVRVPWITQVAACAVVVTVAAPRVVVPLVLLVSLALFP